MYILLKVCNVSNKFQVSLKQPQWAGFSEMSWNSRIKNAISNFRKGGENHLNFQQSNSDFVQLVRDCGADLTDRIRNWLFPIQNKKKNWFKIAE
jgi:hypothetical protein